MNPRENTNVRQDPSIFEGLDRLSSATRSIRKSERGVGDYSLLSRGGNNGDGDETRDYDGFANDVFGDQNQATYEPSPDYEPRYAHGCDESCNHPRSEEQQLPAFRPKQAHYDAQNVRQTRYSQPQMNGRPQIMHDVPHHHNNERYERHQQHQRQQQQQRQQYQQHNHNGCRHNPKCRYFPTYGFWCKLSDRERKIIRSIRQ